MKTCFFIAPIGDEGSDQRKHSDMLLEYVVAPAALEAGLDVPVRADHISKPGIITNQIIERLVEDDLVIADLSLHNPNVFYELAVRHAVQKPIIQLISKGERIPFDVSPVRTIEFVLDLEGAKKAKEALVAQINECIANGGKVENPLSSSVKFNALKDSVDPLDRGNAEILGVLHQIASRLDDLVVQPAIPIEASRPAGELSVYSSSEIEIAEQNHEVGLAILLVTRPIPVATAKFELSAEFDGKPHVTARLKNGVTTSLKCFTGVDASGHFNVHLNASPKGAKLNPGEYVVEYEATFVAQLE